METSVSTSTPVPMQTSSAGDAEMRIGLPAGQLSEESLLAAACSGDEEA